VSPQVVEALPYSDFEAWEDNAVRIAEAQKEEN
jgi:hypothetical protein